jgi:hypothetical protein
LEKGKDLLFKLPEMETVDLFEYAQSVKPRRMTDSQTANPNIPDAPKTATFTQVK